ncbi:uncharacterized protein N7469_003669 [Penicillium citrinum]|uniref:Uncharacterized protein n=2 Tax=Penicillium TaxID=5073 RepID=A0A9W9TPT5_PENCI|nr:uncharacterized protein N7469_003669 [Penicillium citrinum]KAJ5234501.1 hypothetical protein N7469_003669 [Penicillium citrinum]KAJ5590115.1 hypothetical protein N7450_004087 [Penicillium hetheringtonii]
MREVWNRLWDINTIGTHILTYTFAPLLLQSADPRLLFVTSGTSTLAESDNLALRFNQPPKKGWPKSSLMIPAYRAMKAWCIAPGFLAMGIGGNLEMNKQMGAIDPAVGADLVRDVVEGGEDQHVGRVIRRDGVQPW